MKIIDFTVEDDDDGILIVKHRLMPTLQIDDRKPPEPKPHWPVEEIAFVIGTPVGNRIRHILDFGLVYFSIAIEMILAANTAHREVLSIPECLI
jgi:hypothetical protein